MSSPGTLARVLIVSLNREEVDMASWPLGDREQPWISQKRVFALLIP